MIFHVQQAIRAFILLAFSVMLFKLHFSGEMTKFINPKYEGLSQSASVLFLVLFIIQVTRIWTAREQDHLHHNNCHQDAHDCSHDHGDSPFNTKKLIAYLVIVFPLATGFLLPAKVLDASIMDKKGGMAVLTNQRISNEEKKETNIQEFSAVNPEEIGSSKEITKEEYEQLKQNLIESTTIELNDDVYSTYYDEIHLDVQKFKGREIQLKGFVYKEDGLEPDQLVIARFLITHCVADAGIIGFLSEIPEASALSQDTWIEAKGFLDTTTFNGTELPVIKITNWKEISQPKQPYLYPISIRIL
ncbi:TIGR03943 family putative permease subunit [Neobacillus niacini]|uniref:TIGR03943 family putative permease subunit n=1 Tax=Neobacillus niacini TaxID=86668 RepID=UPI0021CAF4C6|nr:TIGR03943 family protein [Neobacillus niacini]MCM3766814.1 TIGR03943 family protein [Neobacillus niacini]